MVRIHHHCIAFILFLYCFFTTVTIATTFLQSNQTWIFVFYFLEFLLQNFILFTSVKGKTNVNLSCSSFFRKREPSLSSSFNLFLFFASWLKLIIKWWCCPDAQVFGVIRSDLSVCLSVCLCEDNNQFPPVVSVSGGMLLLCLAKRGDGWDKSHFQFLLFPLFFLASASLFSWSCTKTPKQTHTLNSFVRTGKSQINNNNSNKHSWRRLKH